MAGVSDAVEITQDRHDKNGNAFIRLTLRDYIGLATMLVTSMVAFGALLTYWSGVSAHVSDSQIHQGILDKQAMAREIFDRGMDAHIDAGPHEGVEELLTTIMIDIALIKAHLDIVED